MQLQYIGARYVPIWYVNSDDQSANWQINVEYEALTFVTDINNHLYLSKKTVPDNIGDPANNTEYWLDMGVFTNAQIAQLQQEVSDLQDITVPGSLQNQIGDITSLLTTYNSDLVGAINEIYTSLTNVKNDVDMLKSLQNRKFILIGDSYGYGIDPDHTSDQGKGWMDWFADTVGDYCDVYIPNISLLPGVAGFASSLPFLTMLQSLSGTITDKDEITDIVVMGGCNDLAWNSVTETAIKDAIKTFCEYCQTNYPNAHIKIGNICARLKYMLNDAAHPVESYKTCTKYGAEYMNDSLMLYISPDYISADHTHLTQTGYSHYANITNNLIISGHANYVEKFTIDLNLDTTKVTVGDGVSTGFKLDCWYDNSALRLTVRSKNLNQSGTLTVVDRTLQSASTIADAITLAKWFELPLYTEIFGGMLVIRDSSWDTLVAGTYRAYNTDEDSLTINLSPPMGNWHPNSNNYTLQCVVDCSREITLMYA